MSLGGYNHNIRYKDVLFHVQTEDYGLDKHVIVTQLFHEGAIYQKVQTDYQEFIGLEELDQQIKELMKLQHTKMLKDLTHHQIALPESLFANAIHKTNALDVDKSAAQTGSAKTESTPLNNQIQHYLKNLK